MIGRVKPRPFEDDADRRVNLAQCLLRTFRATRQRRVAEFLLLVEPHTTIFTLICINRHNLPLSYRKGGL